MRRRTEQAQRGPFTRTLLGRWAMPLSLIAILAALCGADLIGAHKVQNHRDNRCAAGVEALCDRGTPAPSIPRCQEDEIISGTGDFEAGIWTAYVCEHPDNLSTEWHREVK